MNSGVLVSFVVPCFNEEKVISSVIEKIKEQAAIGCFSYEIIVVDNMSTDSSFEILKKLDVRLLRSGANTVGGVRNEGAFYSEGKLLVFIDADVLLGDDWGEQLATRIKFLLEEKILITGSHCCVPPDLPQPFMSWYKGIEGDTRNTHLGSGHMILTRMLFNKVGGFDEELISGEDYDFCQRAVAHGATLKSDPMLKVYHLGYPDSVLDFVRRESWHGISDVEGVDRFFKSKVAISSFIFIIFHIFIIYFFFAYSFCFLFFTFLLLFSFLAAVVTKKFGFLGAKDFFYKLVASYFYLFGRFASIFRLYYER